MKMMNRATSVILEKKKKKITCHMRLEMRLLLKKLPTLVVIKTPRFMKQTIFISMQSHHFLTGSEQYFATCLVFWKCSLKSIPRRSCPYIIEKHQTFRFFVNIVELLSHFTVRHSSDFISFFDCRRGQVYQNLFPHNAYFALLRYWRPSEAIKMTPWLEDDDRPFSQEWFSPNHPSRRSTPRDGGYDLLFPSTTLPTCWYRRRVQRHLARRHESKLAATLFVPGLKNLHLPWTLIPLRRVLVNRMSERKFCEKSSFNFDPTFMKLKPFDQNASGPSQYLLIRPPFLRESTFKTKVSMTSSKE